MISPGGNTIRRSVKTRRLFLIAGTLLVAVIICSCEEYPPYAPGLFPRAAPAGWWNDDGASGGRKIVVHISEQKAYFYKGKRVVGESPVSTGKPGFSTPPGHYRVVSKDRNHVSSEFGDYVDDYGNVAKSNIDSRNDPQPPGTHFDGARMPYCMHFNGGYAMHEDYVPRYAASHGCIRLPKGMAEHFFDASPEGTPVVVKE